MSESLLAVIYSAQSEECLREYKEKEDSVLQSLVHDGLEVVGLCVFCALFT